MTETKSAGASKGWDGPSLREFVALMAALMAANAMAIDAMLPALPAIGETLGVDEDNRRQLVISFYLLGFGIAQLFYGPLSDRYGRKGLLVISLLLYAGFALACGLAGSFHWMLAARVLQGMAAAGTRVLVVSITRDRFHGPGMARVMSLAFIVFMIVPVLAPAFGQGVLSIASWRFIFLGLAAYGLIVLLWASARLPETLAPENRRPLSLAKTRDAIATTLSNRRSIGNTIALTLVMGALFAFINSIQQIVFDVFGRPELMAIVFASIAGPMALTSWLNSKIVERFGTRRIMLAALKLFTLFAGLHLAVATLTEEPLAVFVLLHAATMATFGLISANLGATAMEPLGHIAGTASSIQGLITTIGGALLGLVIGQQFDGTVVPMLAGFGLCGAGALIVGHWANRPQRIEPDDA